ncbi:permease prefix domain 1-containing protein [Asanoa siamensis]|uniref:ABC-2 type transport system permease protein n=1 Tax=Asanoa siamensis TaxID=926357 RepID=A0ABQ4D5G8_9ACTN|nr:permease prefix domain 1-containing protein [Asanoa siamensis]GIF78367.1 hypothetical protein Asi02nite_78850 [Asanoa siamensis]
MSSLTDRYLAATLGSVPAARRDEIASELRGSIEDMIEGKVADGHAAATAEREVLTEMGDPAVLAARYANRRLQLIGPAYYLIWLRLLKLLLAFVPAVVGIVAGLVELADGARAGDAIGEGIGTAIEVAVQVAFWVTLTFAVLERTNTPLNLPAWSVDRLPEHTSGERQSRLADCVASVGVLALLVAYLPVQHFRSFVTTTDGANLPILDPALWTFWLPYLMVVLVLTAGLEIAKYRAGGWTWPLVGVNAVLNVAFAVPVVWLLLRDRLLNPDFVARFEWLSQPAHLDRVATIAVVVTIVIAVWDVVASVSSCRRRR